MKLKIYQNKVTEKTGIISQKTKEAIKNFSEDERKKEDDKALRKINNVHTKRFIQEVALLLSIILVIAFLACYKL